MIYLVTFIEGILTFISPCILPLVPIYISYLMETKEQDNKNSTIINAFGFVLGFTILFVILGNIIAIMSKFLIKNSEVISVVGGIIIILFGLNFINVIKIPFLNKTKKMDIKIKPVNFFKSVLFGIIFATGWTPCVGTFLSSAIISATTSGTQIKGMVLLLLYSIGLGIPFILSAIFINELKNKFDFIKKNYKIVNMISGMFLIIVGVTFVVGGIM